MGPGMPRGIPAATPRRVLVLADYYLPGYTAGGPIRSLANLIEALADEYSFSVLTRDRDLGAGEAYAGIDHDRWNRVGPAEVRYLSPASLSLRSLRGAIGSRPHDVLYANSFFSVPFSIRPLQLRRAGGIPRRRLVVAPRGELSAGALALHAGRKRAYLALARATGTYRDALWQASSQHELDDIRRRFGAAAPVLLAANVPPQTGSPPPQRGVKQPGRLRAVFVSRISPMKNLEGALDALSWTSAEVSLDVYGPAEDRSYWERCQRLIAALPGNVDCSYRGEVPPDEVPGVFAQHDLLLLPSRGESYGHVVIEAMLAGCPVLISDRTPWRGLEATGAGWDLPLEDPGGFSAALERCAAMDAGEHKRMSEAARRFALANAAPEASLENYRRLFSDDVAPGR